MCVCVCGGGGIMLSYDLIAIKHNKRQYTGVTIMHLAASVGLPFAC